jgi:hypothetical protein
VTCRLRGYVDGLYQLPLRSEKTPRGFLTRRRGTSRNMASRLVRLVPSLIAALLSLVVLSSSAVGHQAASKAVAGARRPSHHPMTRLVVHVPQCGRHRPQDCVINLYRVAVNRHGVQQGRGWSEEKYFPGSRVVFHVRRYRMNGLTLVFSNGHADGQFSVVTVRWRHAKVGHLERYLRSDNYGGHCWEGNKPAHVSLTIRYNYTIIGKGTSTVFRVTRPWFARAGDAGRIPNSSRMDQGVDVDASTNAGISCVPSKH